MFRRGIKALFGRYLLLTNTVSCGALMGLGDATVQGLERLKNEKKPYDWSRTGNMTVIGAALGPVEHFWYSHILERMLPGTRVSIVVKKILTEQVFFSPVLYYAFFVGRLCAVGCVLGPLNHGWYSLLDKLCPGVTSMVVARKILFDQLCASPFFTFSFFMGCGLLEGHSYDASLQEFKEKFWSVYKADWMVWPAAQAINFYYLHPKYRVIYVAVVTYGWNAFLSYMKYDVDIQNESERKLQQKEEHQKS